MREMESWEFGALGVSNFRENGPLSAYYDLVRQIGNVEGDLVECGVFRGSSLLATALLLEELGFNRKIYGFDTFSGFPCYHCNDDFQKFDFLWQSGRISESHLGRVKKNQAIRNLVADDLNLSNISNSGDFSNTNVDLIRRKIEFLRLKHINLIEGPFEKTLTADNLPDVISIALLDCDLYEGYSVALPALGERLAIGGNIFVDEYYSLKFPGARIATDEFITSIKAKRLGLRLIKLCGGDGNFERWAIRRGP